MGDHATTATLTSKPTELCIADLMTIGAITVRSDARVDEAEDLPHRYHVSGLPVVNEYGALVGVLSQTDLLHLAQPSVKALIRHQRSGPRRRRRHAP